MWSDIFASLSATTLVVLWVGGFLGGIASGAAGFAFGIAASAIWLHAIEPIHTAFLVVAGGLTIQSGTIWPLRHALDPRRLWPFLLAGVIGVPIGVWLLVRTDVGTLKVALGVFLAIYGVYALVAPRLPHVEAGRGADAAVGFIAGIMGGLGGYSGVLPAIWAQLRGWPKRRRAPSISPSSWWLMSRPSPRSARWRSTARGLYCWSWRCRPWRLALSWAGISTAASTRSASGRRWR